MAKLKPWYKVVTPREDLREGKPLDASEFAVHLGYDVCLKPLRGLRLRFSPRRRIVPLRAGGQPVGLTGRRVEPTARRDMGQSMIWVISHPESFRRSM